MPTQYESMFSFWLKQYRDAAAGARQMRARAIETKDSLYWRLWHYKMKQCRIALSCIHRHMGY